MRIKIICARKADESADWLKAIDITDLVGKEFEAKENTLGTVSIVDKKFGEIDLYEEEYIVIH